MGEREREYTVIGVVADISEKKPFTTDYICSFQSYDIKRLGFHRNMVSKCKPTEKPKMRQA
ncbi:hypothetical protein BT96DRAFT_929709 [Gymnopus androsaceus JB14]|uniref:Uncharacterized protein n=1 Tax=Gymnopus androsaceus JB14 TaxID=1447944 RepID=A0A6A4GDE6_9AGAR|nr:hypothetical protein BT96DRAFT_929709 [Gymnopus androsaceus JB14]